MSATFGVVIHCLQRLHVPSPKRNPMTQLRLFTLAAVLLATLSACGGGGAKVSTQTTTTTVGQELQDLDEAYAKGLISEREYKKQREKVLER